MTKQSVKAKRKPSAEVTKELARVQKRLRMQIGVSATPKKYSKLTEQLRNGGSTPLDVQILHSQKTLGWNRTCALREFPILSYFDQSYRTIHIFASDGQLSEGSNNLNNEKLKVRLAENLA